MFKMMTISQVMLPWLWINLTYLCACSSCWIAGPYSSPDRIAKEAGSYFPSFPLFPGTRNFNGCWLPAPTGLFLSYPEPGL